MDELGSITQLASKNEWGSHGEKEGEEGRAKENREKNIGSKELLEKDIEEDRTRDKERGQGPCETRGEEARAGEFGSERGDRFRPAPGRDLLCGSESAALTPASAKSKAVGRPRPLDSKNRRSRRLRRSLLGGVLHQQPASDPSSGGWFKTIAFWLTDCGYCLFTKPGEQAHGRYAASRSSARSLSS
jgi:hypothetical protein